MPRIDRLCSSIFGAGVKFVIFAISIAGFATHAFAAEPVEDVSLLQLIATPERFEGKVIRTVAYLRLEFEGDAVYLHREDSEKTIFKNGIWIDVTESQRKVATKYNNSYVSIEGTFDSNGKGHFGLWAGSLKKINNLSKWAPRH